MHLEKGAFRNGPCSSCALGAPLAPRHLRLSGHPTRATVTNSFPRINGPADTNRNRAESFDRTSDPTAAASASERCARSSSPDSALAAAYLESPAKSHARNLPACSSCRTTRGPSSAEILRTLLRKGSKRHSSNRPTKVPAPTIPYCSEYIPARSAPLALRTESVRSAWRR